MSNFIKEADFEKINLTLKNKLNNLLQQETKDNFPKELEKDLKLLCQKIINFQEEENIQKRDLLQKEISSFMNQILTKYQECLDINEQDKLFNLLNSMKIIAFIISGLYFVKNNEFANTLESIKNLYNGIDLIVVQIESSSNVVPEKIQIQLLELLKKLKLNNKNRPSFTDEKDDSNFINYTTAITRATISGINSILENINKIREIEHNKKRELALQQLKERIEKRKKEGIKETPETKKFEKTFYEIMDSFRPEGWKLYQEN